MSQSHPNKDCFCDLLTFHNHVFSLFGPEVLSLTTYALSFHLAYFFKNLINSGQSTLILVYGCIVLHCAGMSKRLTSLYGQMVGLFLSIIVEIILEGINLNMH